MSRVPDKRPFALTSALLLSLFAGLYGSNDGCARLGLYRNFPLDPPMDLAGGDAQHHADVVATFARLAIENDASRSRGVPLAAAAVVLGIAAVFFSLRAFARAPGSRSMLWQLAVVQLALVIGTHFALPRLTSAEMAFNAALQRARQSETGRSEEEMKRGEEALRVVMPAFPIVFTAGRSLLHLLVLLVLTRRATRDYFDAPQPTPERG